MSDWLQSAVGGAVGVLATAGALYMAMRPRRRAINSNLTQQSIPQEGSPHIRLSPFAKNGKPLEYLYEDTRTFYEVFRRGCKVSGGGPCLGWRPAPGEPYSWVSYDEVLQRATHIGSGLIHKGLKPINSTRIGIYSKNRVEYTVTELACYTYSMTIVPLYDTLGPDACTYIINQAEISMVVCDSAEKVKDLLKHIGDTPGLKNIVCVEDPAQDICADAKKHGIEILTFAELQALGKKHPHEINPCKPDDLCTICYTSGTTGNPKGAMITHKSLVADCCALQLHLDWFKVTTEDIIISYLPLAHMYQRVNETFVYLNGGRVGFYQGDIRLLMDDIATLKPTVFPTVPRLLNRMYDKVHASVNGSRVKRWLLEMAISRKLKDVQNGIVRRDSLWDKLVFKKVQQSLGGKCRMIVTGSAPVSPRVLNFTRCAAGCPVLEGYGQTECVAVATLQLHGEGDTGHVGAPLACNEMKVVDIPEMDYYASNMQGEVCIRGPNVFRGYLGMPEKSKEVIDSDGWLHTGDIGQWTSYGAMKIIDRKKNIFKLAQGEYIAPEKIENAYLRSSAVAQMFVHGDSLKAWLVGIVVPDHEVFKTWVQEKIPGVEGSLPQLCQNKAVVDAVLAELTTQGKAVSLNSYEQVKAIHLHPDLFSVENRLLTPTLKAKRCDIQKRFQPQIDNMYSKLG